MQSTPEILTLTEMLLAGHRIDGRSLNEYREISFRFPQDPENENNGCCIVKIGSTAVMARVSAEVIEPKHFRPSQGMLFVNFDASLIKPPKSLYSRRSRDDEGRRLSTVLQTLFRDAIDLDALCIVAWERVFAIRVELRALSYDGNLGDCGALAAISALTAFRRPDVFVQDDGKVIVDTEAKHRPRVPLGIRRIPVLVTLGLTADAKVILQDPTAREDNLLTGGRMLIGMTGFSEVCCLYTTGLSTPIRSSSLSRCVRMANTRAQSLVALVQRVRDSLLRQREASLAAAHARASEIEGKQVSAPVGPMILSTISFLPEEVNPTVSDECEEGELVGEELDALMGSDTDMDVVTSEEEEPTTVTEVSTRASVPVSAFKSLSHNDPYGVIEVQSLKTDVFSLATDPVRGDSFDEQLQLPGIAPTFWNVQNHYSINSNRLIQRNMQKKPDNSRVKHSKASGKKRKITKKMDEEEDEVTVVHLK
ncbi:unnamed protein product [Calicophoron daubneyi]|uniref:Exosome complex component RRP45 n=1 Tax=Calicophoron daubneyi TaxID=300641 RepID=A0AAV2U2P3_CALDB